MGQIRYKMEKRSQMVSVCTYCGVGCEIEVEVENNKIQKISHFPGGVSNGGGICVKGRYGFKFLEKRLPTHLAKMEYIDKIAPQLPFPLQVRLANLTPYDHRFYQIPFTLAVDLTSWQLGKIVEEMGGEAVAGIGGARTNLESGWLFQKFIREVIGSPNVDNCARVCHAPSLKGLKRTIGEGASSLPFDALFQSEVIFVIGSNTTHAHPMVAKRIIEATRRGAKLIVVDVREIELMKFADISVILPFETNLLFLNSLAREILEKGLEDREFIARRTGNFSQFKTQLLSSPDGKESFRRGGFGKVADAIEKIAPLLTRKTAFLWGLGVTEHLDGSDAVSAIANLALLSGNFGEGAGVMPLRGQNNVQGACDVGCLPYYLPDYQPPEKEGLKTPQIFDAILEGKIGAVVNMGEDLLQIHPNQNKVAKAIEKLPFLVVLEVMESRIVEKADIVFAVKSGYEKEGVYVNAERRLHLTQPLVTSHLPDDWEVIQKIAQKMGGEFNFASTREVLEEGIAREVGRFAGARYARLKNGKSLQWPIAPSGEDTPILHREKFSTPDGLGYFHFAQWEPRGELQWHLTKGKNPTGDISPPWYLTTGRDISQYNNGSQTDPAPQLHRKYPEDVLLVNPIHRPQLGERVQLKSQFGVSAPLKVRYTSKIRPYTLYTTFHFAQSRVNFLFGDEADRHTLTARFKSVEVEVIPNKKGEI
jgi:formate dehydrogenase major subunit